MVDRTKGKDMTSLVRWTDRLGGSHSTRVVTAHVEAFSADVTEFGGEVHEVEQES